LHWHLHSLVIHEKEPVIGHDGNAVSEIVSRNSSVKYCESLILSEKRMEIGILTVMLNVSSCSFDAWSSWYWVRVTVSAIVRWSVRLHEQICGLYVVVRSSEKANASVSNPRRNLRLSDGGDDDEVVVVTRRSTMMSRTSCERRNGYDCGCDCDRDCDDLSDEWFCCGGELGSGSERRMMKQR
jgi:hypothetical protein